MAGEFLYKLLLLDVDAKYSLVEKPRPKQAGLSNTKAWLNEQRAKPSVDITFLLEMLNLLNISTHFLEIYSCVSRMLANGN